MPWLHAMVQLPSRLSHPHMRLMKEPQQSLDHGTHLEPREKLGALLASQFSTTPNRVPIPGLFPEPLLKLDFSMAGNHQDSTQADS